MWKLVDEQLGRKTKTNSFSCKHFREVTILRYSEQWTDQERLEIKYGLIQLIDQNAARITAL